MQVTMLCCVCGLGVQLDALAGKERRVLLRSLGLPVALTSPFLSAPTPRPLPLAFKLLACLLLLTYVTATLTAFGYVATGAGLAPLLRRVVALALGLPPLLALVLYAPLSLLLAKSYMPLHAQHKMRALLRQRDAQPFTFSIHPPTGKHRETLSLRSHAGLSHAVLLVLCAQARWIAWCASIPTGSGPSRLPSSCPPPPKPPPSPPSSCSTTPHYAHRYCAPLGP